MTSALALPSAISHETLLASRILIIEDSEFSSFMAQRIFREYGFINLLCAYDGEDGLIKVTSYKPHLILLDLLMPKIDGYEFCERLRRIPDYKDVPVLVLTGVNVPDQHSKIFALGATDLVTKPVNAGELMARTKVHLEKMYLLDDLWQYRKRVAEELMQARQMQNGLMPNISHKELCRKNYGVNVAHYFETCSEMGGDMWGFSPVSPEKFSLFMSDFTGHGITAALNSFRLHTIMREMPIAPEETPGAYLSRLNTHLAALLDTAQFATMFLAVADIAHSTLHYAAAATTAPLLWQHKKKRIEKLHSRGLPLSVKPDTLYSTHSIPYEQGDILILYSDAFVETSWRGGNMLTEEKVMSYLEDALHNGLKEDADALCNAFIQYFGAYAKLPVGDDLTLSVYQRL